MSVLTGNNIKVKTFLFPLILIVGLCYGCEDKPKEQVIDPNNLFQFVLKDENPNSKSFNNNIGPSIYKGRVSVYYFGDPG
tara:strand:+ start:594 stop:833 length:240 start_codon:yes stop_codon:yes gene_type:complete